MVKSKNKFHKTVFDPKVGQDILFSHLLQALSGQAEEQRDQQH